MPLTSTTTSQPPTSFLLVLYPGHQLLDSAGPLDILSTITKSPEGAGFTLTIAADTLDPVDLAPRSSSPDWKFQDIPELPRAPDGGFGGLGFNPRLVPDVTFKEALESLKRGGTVVVGGEERSVDVVLIPGGIGSRMVRVGKDGERTSNVDSLMEFIKEVNRGDWVRCAWMTVCTGSDVLARTGLLNERRATTNVRAFEGVKGRNVGVEWLEKRRWVRSLPGEVQGDSDGGKEVIKREVWTSAGVSAGMDLMLWFVAEVWGMEFARMVAGRIEYEWRESVGEGERDPFYG